MESKQTSDQESVFNVTKNESEKTEIKEISKTKKEAARPKKNVQFGGASNSLPPMPLNNDKRTNKKRINFFELKKKSNN